MKKRVSLQRQYNDFISVMGEVTFDMWIRLKETFNPESPQERDARKEKVLQKIYKWQLEQALRTENYRTAAEIKKLITDDDVLHKKIDA